MWQSDSALSARGRALIEGARCVLMPAIGAPRHRARQVFIDDYPHMGLLRGPDAEGCTAIRKDRSETVSLHRSSLPSAAPLMPNDESKGCVP